MEHFLSKTQYTTIKFIWSTQAHSAEHHVIYNILRGLEPFRGFHPFKDTNLNKIISNYGDKWNGFNSAKRYAKYIDEKQFFKHFGVQLTPEIKIRIDKLL